MLLTLLVAISVLTWTNTSIALPRIIESQKAEFSGYDDVDVSVQTRGWFMLQTRVVYIDAGHAGGMRDRSWLCMCGFFVCTSDDYVWT